MNGKLVKNLKLLKKISIQKCDILRLEIQDCVSKIAELSKQARENKEQYLVEEAFSAQMTDIATQTFIDSYRLNYQNKQADISKALDEMEYLYENLHFQLSELFSEQKSYEITINDLTEQDVIRKKKEETDFFNELSIQKWQKIK